MDTSEIVSIQIHALVIRNEDAADRHRGPADGGVVIEDRANAEDGVRPIDDLSRPMSAHFPKVDTIELGMIFGQRNSSPQP
jgi:hypothetical protein